MAKGLDKRSTRACVEKGSSAEVQQPMFAIHPTIPYLQNQTHFAQLRRVRLNESTGEHCDQRLKHG